jgi:hypothetical protein
MPVSINGITVCESSQLEFCNTIEGSRALTFAPGTPVRSAHRNGTPRQSPAVREKRRCRMHGGAKGSGAPPGKRNGNYKHGQFTREVLQERKALAALLKALRANAAEIK